MEPNTSAQPNTASSEEIPTTALHVLAAEVASTAITNMLEHTTAPPPPVHVAPVRSDVFLALIHSNDKSLKALSLRGCRVTAITMGLIGEALRHNRHLSALDLADNHLQDEDLTYFLECLEKNTGLRTLDISDNPDLTGATMDRIISLVQSHNDHLAEVRAAGTGITASDLSVFQQLAALNRFPAPFKRQVFRAMRNDGDLFSIDVRYDPSDPKVINTDAMATLAAVLVPGTNDTVRSLTLDRCCRGDEAVRALLPVLSTNPRVRALSLQDNYLGDEAIRYLCEGITAAGPQCGLEDIDLCHNELTDDGLRTIIRTLQINTSIRSVKLLHNRHVLTPALLEEVRLGTALNCEPSSMKLAVERIEAGYPERMAPAAEREAYERQRLGEITSESGILRLEGTSEDLHKGPGRGYYSNLGATTIARALERNITVHTVLLANNHIGPNGALAFAKVLEYNPTIVRLDLSRNPITDEGARYLLNAIKTNDALVFLGLEGSSVTDRLLAEVAAACHLNQQPAPLKQLLQARVGEGGPKIDLSRQPFQVRGKWRTLHAESIPYVLTLLRRQPQTTELVLADNDTLGDKGILQLCEWIKDTRCTLTRLDLSNTEMTDAALEAMTAAMRANYSLRTIAIGGNLQLTTRPRQRLEEVLTLNGYPPEVKDIVPLLAANVPGIEAVNFSRRPLAEYQQAKQAPPPALGDDTVRLLCNALIKNTHVRSVTLRNQDIGNRGAAYIADALATSTTIRALDLSHNAIGPDGAAQLAAVLEHNASLERLSLSGNPIGDSGAAHLLVAMKTINRSIAFLAVDGCRLRDATRQQLELMAVLNTQPTDFRTAVLERIMTTSYVRYSGDPHSADNGGACMTDANMEALAVVFAAHAGKHKVVALELPHNNISDEGCRTLLALLSANPTITDVVLSGNPITEAVVPAILEFLAANAHVTTFSVGEPRAVEPRLVPSSSRYQPPATAAERERHEALVAAYGSRPLAAEGSLAAGSGAGVAGISPAGMQAIDDAVVLNRAPEPFRRAFTALCGRLRHWGSLQAQLADMSRWRRRSTAAVAAAATTTTTAMSSRKGSQNSTAAPTTTGSPSSSSSAANMLATAAEQQQQSHQAVVDDGARSEAVARRELAALIDSAAVQVADMRHCAVGPAELRLLMAALSRGQTPALGTTLRGLSLADNPDVADPEIVSLVHDYLLPLAEEGPLQVLHLSGTGLQGPALEALVALAEASQTLVAVNIDDTPLAEAVARSAARRANASTAHSAQGAAKGAAKAFLQDANARRASSKAEVAAALAVAEQEEEEDLLCAAHARLVSVLATNRAAMVHDAADALFAPHRLTAANALLEGGRAASARRRLHASLQYGRERDDGALMPCDAAALRAAEDTILSDALSDAPTRKPYTRGVPTRSN